MNKIELEKQLSKLYENNQIELAKILKSRIQDKVIPTTLTESEVNEIFDKYENPKASSSTLNEAVTYIDNAGNLKTTSEDVYNKSMHEYDTDINWKEKAQKGKNKEYKLITEDEDITDLFEDALGKEEE